MIHWPYFPHEPGGSPQPTDHDGGWGHVMQMQRELWHRWWDAGQGWLKWWLPPLPEMPPPAGHVAPPDSPPPMVVEPRPATRRPTAHRSAGAPAARKTTPKDAAKTQRHH